MIAAAIAIAVATPVPDNWVDAVQTIESGGEANPDSAVGDGGKAAGRFQFHKSAWADATKVRKAAGLKTWPYAKAKDPVVAREYAASWLAHLAGRLTRDIGRPANAGETWLAWNLGYEGFRRYKFQLALVPDDKFAKAARINNLVATKPRR